MAKEKRASLQDIIRKRQQEEFVGRSEQLALFRTNLARRWDDEQKLFIFNVFGQGGVGKSTLLRRYQEIAKDVGALTVLVDEQEEDIPDVMARMAQQLEHQGRELKQFGALYRKYRQKREELETSPDAPPGLASFAARTLTKTAAHVVRQTVPGSGVVMDLVNEDAIVTQAGEWAEYVRRRLTNKDEVRLLLRPAQELTPIFLSELGKISDETTLVIILDTYENTSVYLDDWLRGILDGRFGEIPPDIIFVIGGREQLDRDLWLAYSGVIAFISLEAFSEKEATAYLIQRGISDERVIDVILKLSGRLPLLVALLAAGSPDDPSQVGEPSGTAIARFLKWVDDHSRRQVALQASLPRHLNYDVFAVLVPEDTEVHFSWLKEMPFVKEQVEGWVYHEVVRTHMLRHKRLESPQDWEQLHNKLADYYLKQRDALMLNRFEGIRNLAWQDLELSYMYHTLCGSSGTGLKIILSHFVAEKGKASSYFYMRWAELVEKAGKDSDNDLLKDWGKLLVGGEKAYSFKNYANSVELFTELIKYFKNEPELQAHAFKWRGKTQRLLKKYNEAIKDLNKAIELFPLCTEMPAQRGLVYMDLQDYENAFEDFSHALDLDDLHKDHSWILSKRGITLRLMKRFEEALSDLNKAIKLNSAYKETYANRGEVHRNLENFRQALDDFNQAIYLSPNYIWALIQRGVVNRFLGRYTEALQDFRKVVEISPSISQANDEIAYCFMKTGKIQESIEEFDRILSEKPNYPWALIQRGVCHYRLENMDLSHTNLETAITIDPNNYWAYINRGEVLRAQQSFDAALADFMRATELTGEDGWAQYELGITYFSLEQNENAKSYLSSAIEQVKANIAQYPYQLRNAFKLAHYYLTLGEREKAESLYLEVLQKDPPLDRVNDAIIDLEELLRTLPQRVDAHQRHRSLKEYLEEHLEE